MGSVEGGKPGSMSKDDDRFLDEGNVSSEVTQVLAEGEELWTVEEMESAIPCDIIEIDEETDDEQDSETVQSEGEGVAIEGAGPEVTDSEDGEDVTASSGGYNYPPPFTRYSVFDSYKVFPYSCVGKLFFKRNGRSYVCSAASIGGDAIWTAGHCLHSGNNKPSGWATNVIFVPAYKNGHAPFGQWHVKQSIVRRSWYRYGNPKGLCQDMGAAIVYKKKGKRLSQVVGRLGIAWNYGKYRHWTQFGYPAASPFDGQKLIVCSSSFAYSGSIKCKPLPVGVGSDLTGGSSGGPWILRFGTGNYLNGNNSYRRRGKTEEMFSPYFNNNAKSLYDDIIKRKS